MTASRSRPMHLLTRERVADLVKKNAVGKYADGGNLFLHIPSGNRVAYWYLRYESPTTGKERYPKIGNEADYTLALARSRAAEMRRQLDEGIDPMDAREAACEQAARQRAAIQQVQESARLTLRSQAEALHVMMVKAGKFKTPKSEQEWLSKLEANVPREVWLAPMSGLTEGDFDFMRGLWATKYPTAKKVRQRLEAIFHFSRRYAPVNIPAIIKRDLHLVKAEHVEIPHRALVFSELPMFLAELRKRSGVSARALEFCIVSSSRTNEIITMEWRDYHDGVWTVPSIKMKEGKPHRVQLSKAAVAILNKMRRLNLDKRIVFPSETKPHTAMSNMAMLNLVARMGYKNRTTVHGLARGSFSAWAYSQQKWSEDVIECCLAHKEADRVKRAYSEGRDLQAFTGQVWAAWADYIYAKADKQRKRSNFRAIKA